MKQKRIDATLKQVDLATRLDRPQSFVAKYENGERRLDVIEFIEIARAIGFDPVAFIEDFLSSDDESGTASADSGGAREGVPSRTELSCPLSSGVPSRAGEDNGTEADTYIDRAGHRRRRRLASPEDRHERDDTARRLYGSGWSYREIARALGCGRGTVERAIGNAVPPNRTIRGERRHGKAHVMIDAEPLDWKHPPEVAQISPSGPDWGFRGAGPNQLAWAILLTVTDKPETKNQLRHFVDGCIGRIEQARDWVLKTNDVRAWLRRAREHAYEPLDETPVILDVEYVLPGRTPGNR